MTDPEPLLDAVRRRSAALIGKDVEELLALLHPNFVYVNTSGRVLGREEYLDVYVRPDGVRWTSQTIDEPRVAHGGTAAVVTCLVHDVARFYDQELDATFRSTFTWVDTGDGWQCLGGHTASLAEA